MTFEAPEDTSTVAVTRVSKHGLWVSMRDEEVFLPFAHFPWFMQAPLGKVLNVRRPSPHLLYWPDLDIELEVESICYPEPIAIIRPEESWTRRSRLA